MKKYHIPTIIFENEFFSITVKMELNAAFFLYFNDELHFNVLNCLLKIRGNAVSSESLEQTFEVVNILPLLAKMDSNKLECLFIYSHLCYLAFKYSTTSIAIDIHFLTNLLNLNEETVLILIKTLMDCNLISKEPKHNHYIVNFAQHISR